MEQLTADYVVVEDNLSLPISLYMKDFSFILYFLNIILLIKMKGGKMEEKKDSIKKKDLWMISTIVLAIAVIVLIIFMIGGRTTNNAVQNQEEVNMEVILENPSLYPSLGPENADKVVVEFSDFQCPYCALAAGLPAWSQQYASQYSDLINVAGNAKERAQNNEIRFVYVPMSFLGQESVYAAEAALCANKQGKFWEMHDAIFIASDGPSENTGKYSKENLKIIAQQIQGLDTNQFNDCLDNDETISDVQQITSSASQFATGTPTFYVNGKQVAASNTQLSIALQ